MKSKSKNELKIRLGIQGVSGKMGRKLLELIESSTEVNEKFHLVFAVTGPQDPRFKSFAKQKCDVVIDFSAPAATLALADLCSKYRVPLVVCTTGFTKSELGTLRRKLKNIPWVYSANTSLGVFVLKKIVEQVTRVLPHFEIEIVESHHRFKKDAPSGTAIALREKIISADKNRKAIPTHSLRGGTEIGEHDVHFLGDSERLVLGHRALDRGLFALGALTLAEKIISLKAKSTFYSSDEIFQKNFAL
jgi:4-hydroxy-tetrahydrodipicolinate reductase